MLYMNICVTYLCMHCTKDNVYKQVYINTLQLAKYNWWELCFNHTNESLKAFGKIYLIK